MWWDNSEFLLTSMAQLASFLYKKFIEESWIDEDLNTSLGSVPGVVLRSEELEDGYSVYPRNAFPELGVIASRLDIGAGFTMRSKAVSHLVDKMTDDQTEVTLMPHRITVPVTQSLQVLATGEHSVMRRDHACFVVREGLLLLWSRTPDDLTDHAKDMEGKLIDAMWGRAVTRSMYMDMQVPRAPAMLHDSRSISMIDAQSTMEKNNYSTEILAVDNSDDDDDEEDAEKQKVAARPFVLTQTLIVSIANMLIIITTSGGIVKVLGQVKILGSEGYSRLAFLAMIPVSLACCLFFFMIIVNSVFQLAGPIKDIQTGNSRFYSSVKPNPKKHKNMSWPHITIQMPVYKESLKGVIQPTVNSLLPAIAEYERMGGTASIFVADDGMQVISAQLAELRQAFYKQHGIGWVARPPHGKDGFIRGGRFKKASNLNYALDCTLRLEDELLRLIAVTAQQSGRNKDELTVDEEHDLYEQALATIIKQDEGRTEAEGNIRMGEIILLIDSDTRVPIDCLGLAAMEMDESPEVAIIQHASGVLKVTDTWFEECIKFFTEIIYLSIRFSVGNGDAAPFVGHNAFLRWKAMQSVRFTEKDGRELFWSESHVSEDFDMALRLQTGGFVVRLATYDNGGFKEGVSLTIFDELLRWEKYAYGCSELVSRHPSDQYLKLTMMYAALQPSAYLAMERPGNTHGLPYHHQQHEGHIQVHHLRLRLHVLRHRHGTSPLAGNVPHHRLVRR